MSTAAALPAAWPALHLGPLARKVTDDEFFDFCQINRDWRIERTSEGEVIVMPPAGAETGGWEFKLIAVFSRWVEADGTGIGFGSSAGFILPNGAVRSPDLAWVKRSQWQKLTKKQRAKFAPLCPDFVVEIRSPSDSHRTLREKMREYIANGARLGWLIDPLQRQVHIYRPGRRSVRLDSPETLDGDPVLPGFHLKLALVWGE